MSWDDILGQDAAKQALRAHVASGRVPSAYLLTGPDGVGKCRLAVELAKALNCEASGTRPCDACASCTAILRGAHPDLHRLAPTGASERIGIEAVRGLLERITLRPFRAAYQVAIVESADRLTEEAANSLLKSLEEPPARARFVLTTARPLHCLPTIVSRCQLVRCQPLAPDAIRAILMARPEADPEAVTQVMDRCGGSAARALELMGRQARDRHLLGRLADETQDAWLDEPLPTTRQDVADLLEVMIEWIRDLAVAAGAPADGPPVAMAHPGYEGALRRQAAGLEVDRCLDLAFELMRLRESLEQFVNPRLVASLARELWLNLVEAPAV